MSTVKRERRRVDGVLLLDKPLGLSSNAALQRAKRLFRALKAGHTGTLDPLATGLLPLCFGEATKFSHYLLEADKTYLARLRLGQTTTTGDAEGAVTSARPVAVDEIHFRAAMARFLGEIEQIPPRFSALKHQGRAHYEYARQGIDVPRPPRRVRIDRLSLSSWAPPEVSIEVACSKGTYIRTLAEDLGEALGCGAHLAALRRVATAGFAIEEAHTLEQLEALDEGERDALLLPAQVLVAHLPALSLSADAARRLQQGQLLQGYATGRWRAQGPAGEFLGLVQVDEQGELKSTRLTSERRE
ncbi:MAG: tRNA pseudouridine(55) synthase TruB [Betaproteobacteria bacterium]|nr:tRNA pseudouridine(55) synthase TruB [Betaproteobacteria bacterium]